CEGGCAPPGVARAHTGQPRAERARLATSWMAASADANRGNRGGARSADGQAAQGPAAQPTARRIRHPVLARRSALATLVARLGTLVPRTPGELCADFAGRILSGRGGNAAAGMCAVSGEEQPVDRRSI